MGEMASSESLPIKFAGFSSFLGMPLAGFEKGITSLLRRMKARKWHYSKYHKGE